MIDDTSTRSGRLGLLHALRCAGTAGTDRLGSRLGVLAHDLTPTLETLRDAGLITYRDGPMGGWMLTPDGRSEGETLVAEQVAELGVRDRIEEAYRQFLALNPLMLRACSDWQMREEDGEQELNDHTDDAYDARVVGDLASIDARMQPILDDLGTAIARFASYPPRFAAALERVRAGDHKWFTGVRVDSYHTVWFELHEDLLATLGISREEESGHA